MLLTAAFVDIIVVSKPKLFPLFEEKRRRSIGAVISFPLCLKSIEKSIIFYCLFLDLCYQIHLNNKRNRIKNVQCLLFFLIATEQDRVQLNHE